MRWHAPGSASGAKRAGMLTGMLGAVFMGVGPAHATPWDVHPGNPGKRSPAMDRYERPADREEGQYWLRREDPQPLPPAVTFPGLPGPPSFRPPRGQTKSGALTIGELHLEPDGRGGHRGRRPGYRFTVASDGTISFSDLPAFEINAVAMLGMIGLSIPFDVTDWLMRLHGEDPYAYDKARVIEITRAWRDELLAVDRTRRLKTAEAALPEQLSKLWRRDDIGPREKRALLFALWDESLEDAAGPEGAAGLAARAAILDFVRTTLPPGSAVAFSPDELTQFNAGRRSRDRFAP
ncbi:MAG TPA: hypothetical protein VGF45_22150, partial [Polyangia bacterium]